MIESPEPRHPTHGDHLLEQDKLEIGDEIQLKHLSYDGHDLKSWRVIERAEHAKVGDYFISINPFYGTFGLDLPKQAVIKSMGNPASRDFYIILEEIGTPKDETFGDHMIDLNTLTIGDKISLVDIGTGSDLNLSDWRIVDKRLAKMGDFVISSNPLYEALSGLIPMPKLAVISIEVDLTGYKEENIEFFIVTKVKKEAPMSGPSEETSDEKGPCD